jgi:hypothetical protein
MHTYPHLIVYSETNFVNASEASSIHFAQAGVGPQEAPQKKRAAITLRKPFIPGFEIGDKSSPPVPGRRLPHHAKKSVLNCISKLPASLNEGLQEGLRAFFNHSAMQGGRLKLERLGCLSAGLKSCSCSNASQRPTSSSHARPKSCERSIIEQEVNQEGGEVEEIEMGGLVELEGG